MGGSSKRVKIGHWLKAGVHMVFCKGGHVDVLHELIYGERTMWKGTVASSQGIYIDNLNLFGGEKADGGVQGAVAVLFGEADQARHPYLQAYQGEDCPAYRGLFSLLFQDFTWSFIVPQFKPVWARVEHTKAGWDNDVVWYPEKLKIKRLKGVPSTYTVNLLWAPEVENAPSTLDFLVQYKTDEETDWTDGEVGQFVGGAFPSTGGVGVGAVFATNKTTPNRSSLSFGNGNIQNGIFTPNVITANSFNTANNGNPGTNRRKNVSFTFTHDAYEFRVVKTNGSRNVKDPVTGVVSTLTGMDYGGDVVIESVVASVPTYGDINPAHFIYFVATQRSLNLRWPAALIDDVTWQAVADTLYSERFGISHLITDEPGVDLIENVLSTIGGYTKFNKVTGKIELHLMRPSDDIDDLVELNNSNSELVSYNAPTDLADLANTVVIKFRDDDENEKTITENNIALIQSAGGVNSTMRDYEYVHSPRLAKMLGRRDLWVLSSPLPKMARKANRVLWNHAKGDCLRVNDDELGIDAVYRITDIEPLPEEGGKFKVDMVLDVFSLSNAMYELPTDLTEQYDPAVMLPAARVEMIELPYWAVYFGISEAERNVLPEDYGFATSLVTRNSSGAFTLSYKLISSLDNDIFIESDVASYNPSASLMTAVNETIETFALTLPVDMFVDNFDEVGAVIAMIGDELVGVVSYNETTRIMTVKRGVLDTVPTKHVVGDKLVVMTSSGSLDETTRLIGDLVYYKVIPEGTASVLAEENATAFPITFTSRASRPYPPGQFKINGQYYPTLVSGSAINVSWVDRNRLLQTVALVGYDEDAIAAEAGTTYTIKIFNETSLVATYAGLTGTSWDYPVDDQIAHGPIQNLTITLESVRDGLESWQAHSHTVTRTGYGFNYGQYYGGIESIPQPVAIDVVGVTEGGNAVFTVTMSGVFGDQLDHEYSFGGTATAPDIGTLTFSDDVFDVGDGYLAVPAGVFIFTVTVPLINDGLVEVGETLSFTIGTITETITILDI